MISKVLIISLCLFGAAQCSEVDGYQPDIRHVKLEVDGRQYNLKLKQSLRPVVEDNAPIYILRSDEVKGHTLTEVEYEYSRINGVFYNDDEHMATLLARYDEEERNIFYDGLISPGSDVHVVKSAPEEWFSESEEKDENENLKVRSAYVPGEDLKLMKNALSVLKPKFLVVVDYPLYKTLGENINEVFKYVATFFNAVNLRFSKLNSVDVEINVNGIVIAADEKINQVERAKDFFAEKFSEETGLVNYDAIFVLTTSDAEALTGKVHLGSICNRLFSTVYERDDAAFGGLLHTIHDLAHLLNVPHDGVDDAAQCNPDNTVMAEPKQNAEVLDWSECSNNHIKEFAKSTAAACLEHDYRYE